ncbi:LexA family transcriptional regulator [Gorillibacterium timonense]|uniref:hypothetical protein n=1 Tax=Gorillibacterium timonense TaxID=1689269 RepID=UPI00071E2600|nr:hypothetical protein [Gorillibacterium timonense]
MALTKRRLQFLGKLTELYRRTNLPIHYETLANSLGVSKWTAYDMLKEIEKLGFVSRSYEVNPNETGRSQVVFAPTDETLRLFPLSRTENTEGSDWKRTVSKLTGMLKSLKHVGMNEAIRKLLDELPDKSNGMEFCGYIIGLMLVYLKKLGGRTETFIRLVLQKTQNQEARMLLFAGSILGTVIGTLNDELGGRLTELIADFSKAINELTVKEKEMLADLLTEALA